MWIQGSDGEIPALLKLAELKRNQSRESDNQNSLGAYYVSQRLLCALPVLVVLAT